MIYKEKNKRFSRSWFFLVVEAVPVDGVGLLSCDVFLVGELVLVFWLMELDSHLSEGQCSVQ